METSVPSHSNALKRDTSTFFEISSLVLHKKEKKRKENIRKKWFETDILFDTILVSVLVCINILYINKLYKFK